MSLDEDERAQRRAAAEEDSAMRERYAQQVAADERWRRSLRGRLKLALFWWWDHR